MRKRIAYISGKITGDDNYKAKFAEAEKLLTEKGFNVINPCKIGEYEFFSYEQFLHVDFALIDCADVLYMLSDWKESKGATREYHYAASKGKTVIGEDWEKQTKKSGGGECGELQRKGGGRRMLEDKEKVL